MYNLHIATKIKKQLKKQRLNHIKERQYIQNYSNQVQPKLLDNYNKRMNTFLRKMQQHPVIIKQSNQTDNTPHNLFRKFTNNKEKCIGSQVFRFKDKNDWNSLYTEAERTQRKNNEKFMKQKFGDATLAYRSIASDSFYQTAYKHEFRDRNKDREINPPMKYVCEVPKIMIRKLNAKHHNKKMKTQGHNYQGSKQKHNSNHIDTKKNKSLVSKNSYDDDNRSVQSFRTMRSFSQQTHFKNDEQTQTNGQHVQQEKEKQQKQQKQYISEKVHFKTLTESFNLCTDSKFKQNLKEVLVKCKVFRIKDQKSSQQGEIDRLSLVIDNMSGSSNNIQTKRTLIGK